MYLMLNCEKMYYNKQDAIMTQGLAVLSMVVLHLFCRKGADVYGTPLVWLNETTPFVYWFGFFSEICVSLYSICAGYAQELISEREFSSGAIMIWKKNLHRAWKLMKNYWVVLCLFCGIGLILDPYGTIPGSFDRFFKSIFLLYSYNGAWWYLNTYVILMLIPMKLILYPVRKMKIKTGLIFSVGMGMLWYALGRFGMIPTVSSDHSILSFILKEIVNLIGILPPFFAGAFLCKGKCIERCDQWLTGHCPPSKRNTRLLSALLLLFISFNLLGKAMFTLVVAILTFLAFNLLYKPTVLKSIFTLLGKHSTNIWLTHMFFYLCEPFTGLVQKAQYPLFMLLFMLLLCILTSYIVDFILNKKWYTIIK